ncbi:ergothioneine biosynthesis protein EgtC [Streptomyces kaniharaensis]|uniref:Gamma-glutamyl-hercynylcysteine sulfoxide hydrolase n=1 Tax=Streptomyces kaniharaensis TaxID=212423 RepID=A0A6N7KWP6_9ACTN|nr:ergothioneine biosynthesis protein EgtC [Streptomyces kaniharaensis]MQS15195.1 ergothioneine biosynthesis protein EgtC [Streptomyces kaniharaensis]
MCRHIAYLGEPVAPRELLVTPSYALYRQSWAPRTQQYGTVNADGFGLGWYAEDDEIPARYRRAGPVWADAAFADLARVIRTRALLAAVRSATDGCAAGEQAAAPFSSGRWLFSHNGAVAGWPGKLDALAGLLPPAELLDLEARTDSALLWALTLHRLRAGAGLGEALSGTVADVTAHTTGRLNLLLTDGRTIAATTWGDTLHHRTLPGLGVVVASEPYDDDPNWTAVPDGSLLLAGPSDAAGPSHAAGPSRGFEPMRVTVRPIPSCA